MSADFSTATMHSMSIAPEPAVPATPAVLPDAGAPTSPSPTVRVLVIDADRRVRQSLTGFLELEQGVTVVGAAGDPGTALALVAVGQPDVILFDPRLPELEAGLGFLGHLRLQYPEIKIVAMSCFDAEEQACRELGASEFLSKSNLSSDFLAAVQSAARAS